MPVMQKSKIHRLDLFKAFSGPPLADEQPVRLGRSAMSKYHYPSQYRSIDPLEQAKFLRQEFPCLKKCNGAYVQNHGFPKAAERLSWLAVPLWWRLAPTYWEATEMVFAALHRRRERKFHNRCEGRMGPRYHYLSDSTRSAFRRLAKIQPDSDIVFLGMQSGIRYRWDCADDAVAKMENSEFPLDVFAVGILLLTHPRRFTSHKNLWIECPGSEYSRLGNGSFDNVPYFYYFPKEGLKLDTAPRSRLLDCAGSASGFIPRKRK